MNSNNIYAVYLASTSNMELAERLGKGEIIEGMLEINYKANEIYFTFGERIAFRYNEATLDKKFCGFSDGNSFFRFVKERPDSVRTVNRNG